MTFFFSTTFKATTNPLSFYTAKNTLPNFPYPNFSIISKLSILSYNCCGKEFISLVFEQNCS